MALSKNNGLMETTPLLSKTNESPSQVLESSAGIVSSACVQEGARADIEGIAAREEDGETLGRTTSAEGRAKQYEGMPELKRQLKIMFPALSIGVLLSAVDQTIVVSSYGKIGSDLDALNKTSWIATAYFLTLTSFQPLYGKLSDIFTRKSCLLVAYALFGLGCLFCGLSQTMDQLIVARAFAGLGGAGMTTIVSILLSDIIPLKERGQWQGYINIVYATGAGIGAPLGGIFSDGVGWRWSFLFQAPICAIAFIAVALGLRLPKNEHSNWKAKLRRIDFTGSMTLVTAVTSLLVGMDRGSNTSWKSKECLIPFCLSVPLFGLFAYVELKVAREPIAPGRIITERSLFAAYLCNFFSFGGYMGALFYLPLYFEAVLQCSATQAGLYLLPNIIAGVSGSLFAGVYMRRTGRYYWLTVVCYGALSLGLIIVVLCSGLVASSLYGIWIGSVISGFSNGVGVTSSLIAIISNATREDQAIGTACSYLFRSLGSTLGVSMSSTLAQQVLRSSLAASLGNGKETDKIVENVRHSLAYIKTLAPEIREIVRQSYAVSTRSSFGLQAAIVTGAAISAWFIREKPLSK